MLNTNAVFGQIDDTQGKKKPKIVGQRELTIKEDESITIQLTDLQVEDKDSWFYPFGFTLKVYTGKNYSLSGNTVIPDENYNGELTVPVSVNDGSKESDVYDLKIKVIAVNDAPVITGQQNLTTTNTTSLTIEFNHLIVSDPDNNYPGGFSMNISSGENYAVSGNKITPNAGFTGSLTVPVKVSDGQSESNGFGLKITVTQGSTKPVITGQTPVVINEDEPFNFDLSYLKVTDFDNPYPSGFTLKIMPGENYSVNQFVISPLENFSGVLTVTVMVNDGKDDSNVFPFLITVKPVNDAPVVVLQDKILNVKINTDSVWLFTGIKITDPDNASLKFAEITFDQSSFSPDNDKFIFTSNVDGIKTQYDESQGILRLVGNASISEYVSVISSIKASFSQEVTGQKIINVVVHDGELSSNQEPLNIIISKDGNVATNIDIPTGFTPNGDSVNDTWKIIPVTSGVYDQAHIRVFSKNGLLVFESIGFENEWDGTYRGEILPSDVYFYIIEPGDGNSELLLKGIVTILK